MATRRPSRLPAALALGIDLGLSGTRAAVVAEDGTVLSRGRSQNAGTRPGAPHHRQPATWRQEVVEATREALAGVGGAAVQAIGVGGFGPNTVVVDSRLEVLAGPLLFSDDAGSELLPGSVPGTAYTDNAVPKLRRLARERPELVESAAFALDTTGCLVAWLTGNPVMDVLTAADYRLGGVGPPVAVPEAEAPDAIAGSLRAEVGREIGAAGGTPVAVGTYDSYVDLFAMGLLSPGDGALLLGSTLVAAALVDRAAGVGEVGLHTLEWPFTNGLLLGGWTSSAGAAIDWSAETLGPSVTETVTQLPAGSGGLVFLPYLAGERTPAWDPAACGIVAGVTLKTTPGELHRAVVDGVALSARDVLTRMASVGGRPSRWRVGGGGTRHPGWLQATADATRERLEIVDASGGVGAAVLGFRSIGVDVALEPAGTVEPDPAAAEWFDRLFPIYDTLYPSLRTAMHALYTLRLEQP